MNEVYETTMCKCGKKHTFNHDSMGFNGTTDVHELKTFVIHTCTFCGAIVLAYNDAAPNFATQDGALTFQPEMH
jgi:hypothetical protein